MLGIEQQHVLTVQPGACPVALLSLYLHHCSMPVWCSIACLLIAWLRADAAMLCMLLG